VKRTRTVWGRRIARTARGRGDGTLPGLERQAALADAGVALDQDQRLVASGQPGQLALARHQRNVLQLDPGRVDAGERLHRRRRRGARSLARADAFGQEARFRQRLELQLVTQGPLAAVEQLEGGAALAERIVQPHQLAVGRLAQRIVGEQKAVQGQRRGDVTGGLEVAGVPGSQRLPVTHKALASLPHPGIERFGLLQLEAFAEGAAANSEGPGSARRPRCSRSKSSRSLVDAGRAPRSRRRPRARRRGRPRAGGAGRDGRLRRAVASSRSLQNSSASLARDDGPSIAR
jgi:hypothetical protein